MGGAGFFFLNGAVMGAGDGAGLYVDDVLAISDGFCSQVAFVRVRLDLFVKGKISGAAGLLDGGGAGIVRFVTGAGGRLVCIGGRRFL